METQTGPGSAAVADAHADVVPGADPDVRLGEERRVLLFGFGIGITIGFIFLLYIVLGAAHLL
jgi:hypothetical protein